MRTLLVAIHGILTSQTDPSWPDKLDGWMYGRDPEVKVLKKEYTAGPFPRWNCWVKDPRLARGLVNELELLLAAESKAPRATRFNFPPLWLVAHSNGAVIALLVTRRLIARGCRVGGLILTGAACEPDAARNGVLSWWTKGMLGAALAYSSAEDSVLDGAPQDAAPARRSWILTRLRQRVWGWLMWPYGCLGRTGWLREGRAFEQPSSAPNGAASGPILTRWFRGGHCAYFKPENIETTFEQIYRDIRDFSPPEATPASQGPCGQTRPDTSCPKRSTL